MAAIPRLLLTFAICVAGVVAFRLLALPLPFLLGPLFASLIAALAGLRLASWPPLTDTMRTILGLAVGASLTPALAAQLPAMALSLILAPLFLIAAGAAGYPYLRRVCGFDKPTAFYAAMPGGLQDMLIFGEEAGGDPRALSLLHATRVLLIVTVVPALLTLIWSIDLTATPGAPATEFDPSELAIMALAAVVGWRAAKWIGLFGASILGPMILAGGLSLSGVITQRPPAEAIQAAQFFIGMVVGVKYSGITMAEVRRFLVAGLGHGLVLTVIAAIFAEAVVLAGLAPQLDAILAFSPGGQAEMALMAIVAGADVAYVIMHHLVRIMLVITCAPLVFRWLR
ncbi:AbrB family transcriptional regulator [Jannaschia ovalis]|uniref:AbrB family transcriptional regulator n=1 Tax=Jannaschia ovalis TaxID=3038773 RepID=A0ABY8L9T4_9RHOB|nr:AbrB family transcriptional regulator [Jannaschia sp. GRR-S6-38]WGH77372.1 AbrB family transcriptional regulator [Jannaschia sp. GRR-S6-38]